MTVSRARISCFGVVVFFLCASIVYAHGAGLTIESITPEGYKTYIDVNAPVVYQNEPTRLDFEIFDVDGKPKEFTDLWVRIEKEKATIFAGPVAKTRFGLTGFTTILPYAGQNTVFVRFQSGEKTITETSFTLGVESAEDTGKNDTIRLILVGVGGMIIGYLGTFMLMRRKTASLL